MCVCVCVCEREREREREIERKRKKERGRVRVCVSVWHTRIATSCGVWYTWCMSYSWGFGAWGSGFRV